LAAKEGDDMPVRISRVLLVAAIALWVALVAFGNITDYGSNLAFVQHVLTMDTIFPDARIHYRAIHSPMLQHIAYVSIIAIESLTAVLCGAGAWRMWDARRKAAVLFHRAKRMAVVGLTLGMLLWLGGFMPIGGEWFGMWMSTQWNGLTSAFRFVAVLLAALIYLGQRDDELDE
jgi:predicted small integral membrane protein